MIHILHGEDSQASYNRLQLLLDQFPDHKIIKFDEKSNKDEYVMSMFAQDIVDDKKIILCNNYFASKKINKREIESIPENKLVIFWEKIKIAAINFPKSNSGLSIQEFKSPSRIFYLLDSISQESKNLIKKLYELPEEESAGLLWHLTNRVYLMILAKKHFSSKTASILSGRNIQDWQWSKISHQAANLEPNTLKKIFNALLKVDYLKKSGKTDLDEKTILTTLFVKVIHFKESVKYFF